jgi:CubicO group peptidase (beta-lactamase class C family)
MAVLYKKSDDGKSLVPGERWAGVGEPGCVPSPSGGLFSTASDMDRFYSMILAGGELDGKRIVSADAVRQMTTVQTGDLTTGFTPGNGWGLGWCIVREPQDVTGMLSPGTFGHGGAYGTQGWVDPVKQQIFVLLVQRADLGNADGSDLRKEFQQAAVDELGAN